MPDFPLRRLSAAAVFAAVLAGAGTAGAVDDTKPSPMPCGPSYKDPDSDSAHPQTGATNDSLEIKGFFFKHDPAKGAEATTANFIVKNLDEELPEASTSKHWTLEWTSGETTYFVRAVIDYTGSIAYEWGERIPETAAGALPRYEYSGDTQGKLFLGADGVVQLVIPPDIGGKEGTDIKSSLASSNAGYQVLPVAAKTPTRGLSYPWDNVAGKTWKVGPCAAGAPDAGGEPGTPAPPSGGSEQGGGESLPVSLVTKSVKRGRSVKVKLRASEKVTALTARLVKGFKTIATGKLSSLSGTVTLKLRAKKKLRKGTYRLDLAGKDSSGRQRTGAFKLRVK